MITTGPAGPSFRRTAERCQKILERDGVTLKILPSDGSAENLRRLADLKQQVDVGFVPGGAAYRSSSTLSKSRRWRDADCVP